VFAHLSDPSVPTARTRNVIGSHVDRTRSAPAVLSMTQRQKEKAVTSSDRRGERDDPAVPQAGGGAGCAALRMRGEGRRSVRSSGPSFGQRAIRTCPVRRCKKASMGRDRRPNRAPEQGRVVAIHEGEQLLPIGEVEVAGQRAQVVEEGASGRQFAAYGLIDQAAEVQSTVEKEVSIKRVNSTISSIS
jgi:hypothetical protein